MVGRTCTVTAAALLGDGSFAPAQKCSLRLVSEGGAGTRIVLTGDAAALLDAPLGCDTGLCKPTPTTAIVTAGGSTHMLTFETAEDAGKVTGAVAAEQRGAGAGAVSKFDEKIDPSSADLYFHYYGMLQHQQNMLHDYVRTGTYYAAIMENRADFEGKVVMDVGAGTGILSFFAAQAGARAVYCVEASGMVKYTRKLIENNPVFGKVMKVVNGRVEDVQIPEKVDVIISEPMGTLLVNERMLESYIIARDRFLRPGGRMYPALGRIHCAPFSDEALYWEVHGKADFWRQNQNFYGVDVRSLYGDALQGYLSQVVVDAFDPAMLVGAPVTHVLNFATCKEEDLVRLDVPLSFQAPSDRAVQLHGLACWFDVLFDGSQRQHWLTTAPGMPTTHWSQLRCVVHPPLPVPAGAAVTGRLLLIGNRRQSFDIVLELRAPGVDGAPPSVRRGEFDLKDPYYRFAMAQPYQYEYSPEQGQDQQQPQQW